MGRRRRRRRRRRQPVQKRQKPWVGGGGLGSLFKAITLGAKLGKDKRYKRMGAKGVGGAVYNFRRKPWEV